ncbi:nucleotidyltransferase domain-containing protein [Vulcanisaeta sp. JCM 16161]|uniref:nucleotidyltransferase domain-containing protein n=1 Tax=Vulcanisaeta sp. JCM 16161 TaxID=1295372 RepID=UPI0006D1C1FB|nr:nucleotidyltransferase domain-containing protein [Vulcanisaeta sp. JCM 16161]
MPSLVDLLIDVKRVRDKVLNNLDHYLGRIRDLVLRLDPNAELMLIGSYVRGDFRPDSDVDVLIISDVYGDDPHKYVELVMSIIREVGEDVLMVLEFHVVSRKTYNEWYSKFIDIYRII